MELSKKIKQLREFKCMTQQELADQLSIPRSTLAGYETEKKLPSYQVLSKIASYFKIPTDYFFEVGVFKDWNTILENRTEVIKQISIHAQQLALNIQYGLDDITLAKLVYAFSIEISRNEDGDICISSTSPIPTYAENIFSNTTSLTNAETELVSLYRSSTVEEKKDIMNLIRSFHLLNEKNKMIILGKCFDLEHSSSVAADEPLKKTGTTNSSK